jgi:hypothetical protein
MHVCGKSDGCVVAKKPLNKDGRHPSAEAHGSVRGAARNGGPYRDRLSPWRVRCAPRAVCGKIFWRTISRPFTVVSGAAGIRPGVHAGFREHGRRLGLPCLRLSASFTRLLPPTRRPVNGPDTSCALRGNPDRRKRRPYHRLRREGS